MLDGSRAADEAAASGVSLESVTGYLSQIGAVLAAVPPEPIAAIVEALLQAARDGRTVLTLGNGGSAATASHFACDLAKTAAVPGLPRLRALALTDNVPLVTALGNDLAYEDIFAEQVRTYARPDDLIIAISASGNSPNVLAAATAAREVGARVIGMTGFGGGSLRLMCDICLVVPSAEYGPVEDAHMVVAHAVTAAIRAELQSSAPAEAITPPQPTVSTQRLDDLAERPLPEVIPLRPRTTAESAPVPTVFLDRDGVINRNRAGYVLSWDEFDFLPGSLSAIARLSQAGYRIFVVTNQACVDKGLVSPATIDDIHRRMDAAIRNAGGGIEAVLYCPHRPGAGCACRKPAPGLLLRARDEYGVDLAHATFIGDSSGDMQAAAAAGVRGLLLLSGLGWQTALNAPPTVAAAVALNLAHATRLLLDRSTLSYAQQVGLRVAISGARTLSHLRAVGHATAVASSQEAHKRQVLAVGWRRNDA